MGTGLSCRCGKPAIWRLILADPRDEGLRIRPDLCYDCHCALPEGDLSGWLLEGELPKGATVLTPEEERQVEIDSRQSAHMIPFDLDGTPVRAYFPSVAGGIVQPRPQEIDPTVKDLLRAVCDYLQARDAERLSPYEE